MLVAMTFNVGLFVCVIAGLALGTLMFGHILAAEPNVGYEGVLLWLLCAAESCKAMQKSQCFGWCNMICCVRMFSQHANTGMLLGPCVGQSIAIISVTAG